jgi:serine/threonine-protein kinase
MAAPDHHPLDDLLDLGIATAFGLSGARGASISAPVALGLEAADTRLEALADLPAKVGKYDVREVIAQGGMGVVVRAQDRELEREVAIKFLRRSLSANQALQRLFRAEARVMGMLEHPGIVAIHDLGSAPDGRLYYVMKLVAGESLQAFLQRGAGAQADASSARTHRRHAVAAFVRVCETMAFAHSRGIVHGDLKPANVMVGAFGEVQILDWGFARAAQQLEATTAGGDHTNAPRVAGTPAFMAPEQARGAAEQVDARTDVFALGGILCQILTGAPPYRGQTREETYLRASRAWLDDAHRRLDTCGADGNLVLLAHRCLAVDPALRPAHAGEVAAAANESIAAVEQRARDLELEAAQARARAAEEQRARRATLWLALVVVAALVAGGAALWWFERHEAALRADAAQRVQAALARLSDLRDRAHAAGADAVRLWGAAIAVTDEAEQLLSGPHLGTELVARGQRLCSDVKTTALRELRDARARTLIEELRPHHGEDRAPAEVDDDHRALFALFAIDPDADAPARVAQALAGSHLHVELAATLHHWAHLRRARRGSEDVPWQHLLAVADAIDPHPTRTALRRTCSARDAAALRALADAAKASPGAGDSLGMLAECVMAAGDRDTAVSVYRLAHWAHPQDYRIAHDLAVLLSHQSDPPRDEITRLCSVAAAVRPDHAHALVDLATALVEDKQLAPARTIAERAVALDPTYHRALIPLVVIRLQTGDMDGAVAAAREVVRLRTSASTLLVLGHALIKAGDLAGSLQAAEQARALAPNSGAAHAGVVSVHLEMGELEAALTAARQGVAAAEQDAEAWYHLGLALDRAGIDAECEAAYRRAIELRPHYAEAHCNLGAALARRGALDEALLATRRGKELGDRMPLWNYPTAQWVALYERMQTMLPQIAQIEDGGDLPADRDTATRFAQLALARGDASRAFAWFETLHQRERGRLRAEFVDHVRAAARVLSAKDAAPELRAAASGAGLRLLHAALASLREYHDGDATDGARRQRRGMLARWLMMSDLAAVRDDDQRAALPADDQQAWATLWQDVRALYAEQQVR